MLRYAPSNDALNFGKDKTRSFDINVTAKRGNTYNGRVMSEYGLAHAGQTAADPATLPQAWMATLRRLFEGNHHIRSTVATQPRRSNFSSRTLR